MNRSLEAPTRLPDSSPKTLTAATVRYRRQMHCFIAVLYGTAVAWGVRNVYYWQPSALDLLVQIVIPVTLAWWAVADSQCRGRPIRWAFRPFFVILAILLVPIYFIWTRGWRGLGWVMLHAIGLWLMVIAAWFIGGSLIFGEEWLESL